MIRLKIDVKKIIKAHLYTGKTATYLDCTLKDNRDGKDQYGNDGFIVQDVGKEAREAGERGPIIGNWKRVGADTAARPASRPPVRQTPPPEDMPADELPY